MIVACNKCKAKYSIPDEKIKGKIVRIKCKKCGTPIRVDGKVLLKKKEVTTKKKIVKEKKRASAISKEKPRERDELLGRVAIPQNEEVVRPTPPKEEEREEEEALPGEKTQISSPEFLQEFWKQFEERHKREREWYIGINNQPVGPLPESQLKEKIEKGEIDENTLVWTEGYPDWIPLKESNELGYLLRRKREEILFSKPQYQEERIEEPLIQKEERRELETESLRQVQKEVSPLKSEEEFFKEEEILPEKTIKEEERLDRVEEFSKESLSGQAESIQQPSSSTFTDTEQLPGGLTPSMVPVVIKKVKYTAYITASFVFIAILGGIFLALYLKGVFNKGSSQLKDSDKVILKQKIEDTTKVIAYKKIKEKNEKKTLDENPTSTIELSAINVNYDENTKKGKPKRRHSSHREGGSSKNKKKDSEIFKKMSAFDDEPIAASSLLKRRERERSSSGRGLSEYQIRRVVTKNKSTIQRCYEKELRRTGGHLEEIKVNISFTVLPSGRVKSPRISIISGNVSSVIRDNLVRCIKVTLRRWVFPQASGETKVNFPVVLTPGR